VWVPATPSSGAPGYNNGGPIPGSFGPGANTVQVQVGTASIYTTQVIVPNSAFTSLQFYMLLKDAVTIAWTLCTDGMVVGTSATQPPSLIAS
jgi:hypothetical protein